MRSALVSFGLVFVAGACSSVRGGETASSPQATARRIVAADNACDLATVLDCYTHDAILMPPNDVLVQGRDAIAARYQRLFADFRPAIVGTSVESWSAGDHAVDRGITRGRLTPRNGSPVKELDDKYVMVLRRDSDGVWRIERLMWSSNRAQ